MITRVKTADEIDAMRISGQMLGAVLKVLKSKLAIGMSTKDLAIVASKELQSLGGEAAFLGYQDFPDVICISINDEIVHGIPKANKIVNEGEIDRKSVV